MIVEVEILFDNNGVQCVFITYIRGGQHERVCDQHEISIYVNIYSFTNK